MRHTALPGLMAVVVFAAFSTGAGAGSGDPFADEDWLNFDPQASHEAINGGELVFLKTPPAKPVHHHQNTLTVHAQSMQDGWASLVQCHDNLDMFPRAQVLYNRERVRNLRIKKAERIGEAWVEDNTVQLRDVDEGARLCVEAESRALRANRDGTFTLRNGPFMRKFLDGYFPMRVSIDIELPEQLHFVSVSPVQQDGFQVDHDRGAVHVDAWFEGRLKTEILLAKTRHAGAR